MATQKSSAQKKVAGVSEKFMPEWQAVMDSLQEGVCILDNDHKIVYANKALYELVGKDASQVVGKSCCELVHGTEKPIPDCPLERTKKSLHSESLEYFWNNRWLEITINPLIDSNKKFIGAVHKMEDITARKQLHQDLQASEKYYRALLENSSDVIALVGMDGTILYNTPSYSDVLGYRDEERKGQNAFNMVHPDQKQFLQALFQEIIQTSKHVVIPPTRIHHKDGSWRWIEGVANNMLNEPNLQAIIVNFHDITESKQAKEEVYLAHKRLNYLISSSMAIIYAAKPSGNYGATFLSENIEQITGYQARQFVDDSNFWFDHIHPEDQPRIQAEVSKLFEQDLYGYEYRFQRKDGNYIWVLDTMKLLRDEKGIPLEIHGTWLDITERKRAEQEIEMLKHSIDVHFDSAYWTDIDNKIIYVNEAGCNTIGYTSAELIGKPLKLISPTATKKSIDRVWEKLRSEGYYHSETIHRRKDGSEFPVEVTAAYVHFAGVEYNCAFARDITERKRIEEDLARERYQINSLMENITDAIYFKDAKGRFTKVSKVMVKKRGISGVEEMIGKTDFDYFTKENAQEVYEIEQEIIRTGKPLINKEVEENWPDHAPTWVSVTKMPLRDQTGKISGLYGISRDITERKRAEEALAQERNLLRALIDNVPDFIYVKDAKSRFVLANPAVAHLMGCTTPEETLGKTDFDFYPNEFAARYFADEQELFKTGQALLQHEEPNVDKAGNPRWLSTTKVLLRDEQGHIIGLVGMGRDITERKQAENELRESEERFRLSFENANTGVCLVDLEGNLTRVNTKMCEIFGYTKEELEQMTVNDIAHQEDVDVSPEFIQKSLQGEIDRGTFEKRYFHKKGHVVTCRVTSSLVRDAEGTPLYFISHVHDITERKQAEEALKKAQQVAHVGSWAWHIQENRLEWSDEMFSIFGINKDTFTGNLSEVIAKAIHPDDRAAVERSNLSVINERKPIPLEYRVLCPDGSQRVVWAEAGELILDDAGAPLTLTGIVQDITDRKRVEEEIKNLAKFPAENPNPVLRIEKKGNLLYANEASFIMLPEWKLQVGQIVPEELRSLVQETFESGCHQQVEIPCGERIFTITAAPTLEADYVNLYARDITELKQAQEILQLQLRRLASLRTIDMAISSIMDLRVSLDVLISHIPTQLNVDAADILLLNPNTQILQHAASAGFRTDAITQTHIRLGEGLAGQVALERLRLYSPTLEGERGLVLKRTLLGEDFIAYYGVPLVAKGVVKGVLEILHRSPLNVDDDWIAFLETLAGQAAIAIENAELFDDLQRSNLDLSLAYDATIEGWSKALDLRDRETEGHTERVAEMTLALAKTLGVKENELVHIKRGALLHDIGKMGIPDSILFKPGPLDESECEIIRSHPRSAFDMLSPIVYLRPALDIPYCHHERWDGSGYPRGLEGEQIPLAARIFSVVDVWDALTSDRPYRKAWSKAKTNQYIIENNGKLFEPKIVEAFQTMMG